MSTLSPDICARAMPRAKKVQQKVPIFKEDDRALSLDKLILYAANSGKMLAAHAQ